MTGARSALAIVKPETVVAWHRASFRLFWTLKVRRGQPGRPVTLQLKAHCGHCVSTGPEVLAREIPLFATQAGHRYGVLPFQKSDH